MTTPPHAKPATADTYAHLLAAETQPRFAFRAQDPAAVRHWQSAFRAELARRLGIPRIAARCDGPPRAVKRGEQRLEDHVREEWELTPEPGFGVPFFLLRPLEGGRRPLVLTPHGHSERGRFIAAGITDNDEDRQAILDGERDIALQAVRQGYVAIAPEARAFGSGRGEEDLAKGLKFSCQSWQMRALMFGRTLIGERVWDLMRLIDYATTRDDIDTRRIVVTGNSGGGTAALFAAAIDERIGVAIPSCYFCTFLDSIGSIRHCACNYIPQMLELGEMADVAGLIAPRPFLAIAGREDAIFPVDAVQRSHQRLRQIYDVAGAGDRCELFIGDGGHRYYKQPVWPFVERWLPAAP